MSTQAAAPVALGGAFYLGGTTFALLDAAAGEQKDTAVLLLPPFGWEDICSYRGRRTWARELAAAGHPALRIDLPGTADSAGGPRDPGLLDAWTDAAADAAGWLQHRTDCERIAVVGIGLGGLVACRAAAAGAPIDELVLWGVPAQGRRLVRELKAFSALQQSDPPPGTEEHLPAGALLANGYLLSAGTQAELQALTCEAFGGVGRALLLDRDALPADPALREALERADVAVTSARGPGFAAMMREPQEADPPLATIAAVTAWLATPAPAPPAHADGAYVPAAAGVLELPGLRETPLTIIDPRTGSRLFGILAEPLGPPAGLTAVLLNAGPQRHTGPNRMWVETARRWAARGIPTFRVDLEAIGDADGDGAAYKDNDALFTPHLVGQTRLVLDELAARGLPPRFLLQGLCAGAAWSMRAALEDPRVVRAVMLNPQVLVPDGWTSVRRRLEDLARQVLKGGTWRRLLRGELTWSKHRATALGLLRTLPAKLRRGRRAADAAPDPVDAMLDRLGTRGQQVTMLFTGGEPLHREWTSDGRMARLGAWPDLAVHVAGTATDTHTLQPLWLQAQVHALADAELAAALPS